MLERLERSERVVHPLRRDPALHDRVIRDVIRIIEVDEPVRRDAAEDDRDEEDEGGREKCAIHGAMIKVLGA